MAYRTLTRPLIRQDIAQALRTERASMYWYRGLARACNQDTPEGLVDAREYKRMALSHAKRLAGMRVVLRLLYGSPSA